jgi:hypothetical protein
MGENMPDKEFLSDLRRAREEEYFHKKERALEEANRQRALREAKRGELGAVIGIFEEHLLNELLISGFTPETIRLLYLIPAPSALSKTYPSVLSKSDPGILS